MYWKFLDRSEYRELLIKKLFSAALQRSFLYPDLATCRPTASRRATVESFPSLRPPRMIEHAALDRPPLAGNVKDGYLARIAMTATRQALDAFWRTNGIKSTFLIAHEGISGTIASSDAGIETVLAHVRALPDCADLDVKTS